jgi:hypothetical protein
VGAAEQPGVFVQPVKQSPVTGLPTAITSGRANPRFVVVGCVLLYVGVYLLLMVRDVPSIDAAGYYEFQSSSRFAGRIGDEGLPVGHRLTIFHSRTSTLNYLFYPLDYIYYSTKGMSVRVEQKWRDAQDNESQRLDRDQSQTEARP